MRIPRPRSLNGLISIGLVLITLPLLLAIARAAYQMDRLATESEHLLLQGVQATQSSQELQENITAMLRNARLYQVIGDQELIEAYDERQHTLAMTLDNLEQLVPIVPLDVVQRVRRDANTIAAGHQQFLEIAMGGRDHPHLDRRGLRAADCAHLVFL